MMENRIFTEKVLEIVRNIPAGKTLSYQEVAALAESPFAARAVGNIMRNNFDPQIPCHRVILSNGKIGDYNRGGETAKRKILNQEINSAKSTDAKS